MRDGHTKELGLWVSKTGSGFWLRFCLSGLNPKRRDARCEISPSPNAPGSFSSKLDLSCAIIISHQDAAAIQGLDVVEQAGVTVFGFLT